MRERSRGWVAFAAICASSMAAFGPVLMRARAPHYAFLQSALVEVPSPTGAPRHESVACIEGGRLSGIPVLLLSPETSTTCVTTTAGPGVPELGDGQCTLLDGIDQCDGVLGFGVVGMRSASFDGLIPQAVTEPEALDAVERSIAKSGRAEAATAEGRRQRAFRPTQSILARPSALVTFPDLPGRPIFARLRVTEEPENVGPWLVIENGEPATFIGPFATPNLTAWLLDGVGYVHASPAGCTECGYVLDEIYVVEEGRLRLVTQSSANAN